MKKQMTLILLILFVFATSVTFSYWGEQRVGNTDAALTSQIKVANFNWDHEEPGNDNPYRIEDFVKNKRYKKGDVVYYNGGYYLRHVDGWNYNEPVSSAYSTSADNPYHYYGDEYISRMYYFPNDLVTFEGKVYTALNEGSKDNYPPKEWGALGTIQSLEWKRNKAYQKGELVTFNGALYLAEKDFAQKASPQPGTAAGWNLQNRLGFDPYTVYRRRSHWGKELPIVVAAPNAQNKMTLFLLVAESNYVNNKLVVPGTNNAVWKEYPYY